MNELLHLYFLAIAREKKHHDGTNYPWKMIGKKSILRSLPSLFFRWFRTIKGPLMQIKKSHDVCVHIKRIPCKFSIFNPKNHRAIHALSF